MIREKSKNKQIVIDLTGPNGNAMVLIATARTIGEGIGWDRARISRLQEEMMSGDYEHLIQTFDRAFGEFVILER